MSEKAIQTGIIGFGLSGRVFHAPFLHIHHGFEIKKIVERNKEESKSIYQYVQVVDDYNELLNDSEIELIVVCTPNTLHFAIVQQSLKAGKHVVVEKPFTPTSNEADELIKLAKSVNRKIFVYQNRRWDGDFLTISKVLKSGVLGNIEEYEAHFDRYKPEINPYAWRDFPEPGAGILYDLGSHLIDQALCLFGKPISILADIQSQRKESEVDDYFRLQMKYRSLNVILTAGMLVEEREPRFVIHGVLGSFVKFDIDPQEEALQEGQMPEGDAWGAENPENWGMITIDYQDLNIDGSIETEQGNYMGFYDNVYDVLRNDGAIAVKPEDARNVIRIIELAFESRRIDKEIEIDF
ncbi:MAG: Gfo/Idh/MocA family oxidoreductase [Bacteroidales bacterium]|nr:Gfo/Idh/MocA family oxidoreductase [Bacteroidales bacterium]